MGNYTTAYLAAQDKAGSPQTEREQKLFDLLREAYETVFDTTERAEAAENAAIEQKEALDNFESERDEALGERDEAIKKRDALQEFADAVESKATRALWNRMRLRTHDAERMREEASKQIKEAAEALTRHQGAAHLAQNMANNIATKPKGYLKRLAELARTLKP